MKKDKKIKVEKVGKVPGSAVGLSLNDDLVNEIKEHLETVPALKGVRGPHGASGEQGRRGRRGLKGETGDAGVDGDHGVDGKPGVVLKGDHGATGTTGRQGVIGPQGLKGDKGDKGEPGEKGKQGRVGPGGGRGAAGRSAATSDFNEIALVGTDLIFKREKAGPLGPTITVDLSSLITPSFQGLGAWRYRTEITAPPASGQVRFDNADPTLATELFLHEVNADGADLANFLALLDVGDTIYMQSEANATKFLVIEIGSTTDSGVYFTFGIAAIAQQGAAFSQSERLRVVAIIAGGGGAGAVINDAVQARRTTSFTLLTAFSDVTLDATDIETDAAVIEHNNAATDDIDIKFTGFVRITVGADIDPSAAGGDTIRAFARVRLNDAGVDIPGSLASDGAFEDGSIAGDDSFGRVSCSFIAAVTSGDKLTLQMNKVEIGGSAVFTAEEITLTVERLK